MMDVNTTVASGLTDGGIHFDQAEAIHRLHHEECLTATEIVSATGHSLAMVSGVLVGRYFPLAAKRWERMQ